MQIRSRPVVIKVLGLFISLLSSSPQTCEDQLSRRLREIGEAHRVPSAATCLAMLEKAWHASRRPIQWHDLSRQNATTPPAATSRRGGGAIPPQCLGT